MNFGEQLKEIRSSKGLTQIELSEKSTYINLGDWLQYYTYLDFDGETAILKHWNKGEISNYEF